MPEAPLPPDLEHSSPYAEKTPDDRCPNPKNKKQEDKRKIIKNCDCGECGKFMQVMGRKKEQIVQGPAPEKIEAGRFRGRRRLLKALGIVGGTAAVGVPPIVWLVSDDKPKTPEYQRKFPAVSIDLKKEAVLGVHTPENQQRASALLTAVAPLFKNGEPLPFERITEIFEALVACPEFEEIKEIYKKHFGIDKLNQRNACDLLSALGVGVMEDRCFFRIEDDGTLGSQRAIRENIGPAHKNSLAINFGDTTLNHTFWETESDKFANQGNMNIIGRFIGGTNATVIYPQQAEESAALLPLIQEKMRKEGVSLQAPLPQERLHHVSIHEGTHAFLNNRQGWTSASLEKSADYHTSRFSVGSFTFTSNTVPNITNVNEALTCSIANGNEQISDTLVILKTFEDLVSSAQNYYLYRNLFWPLANAMGFAVPPKVPGTSTETCDLLVGIIQQGGIIAIRDINSGIARAIWNSLPPPVAADPNDGYPELQPLTPEE
ncbi:MAG: hypothetical protein Q8P95_04105 [bacterium]|nr:hypothetical protein [bacterium]